MTSFERYTQFNRFYIKKLKNQKPACQSVFLKSRCPSWLFSLLLNHLLPVFPVSKCRFHESRFTQPPQGYGRQGPACLTMLIAIKKQLLKQVKLWARMQLYDTTEAIVQFLSGDGTSNFLDVELAKLKLVHETAFLSQVESHLTKGLQCDILICSAFLDS